MNIQDKINTYRDLGLNELDAIAKVCGEIILYKISKTSKVGNITVKGGVVMMNISKDLRRATRDLDLDFIKYSLTENSIIKFIEKLNEIDDDVKLVIKCPITELKHQDYKGKRVNLDFIDKYGKKYGFKLDIGVHKNLELEQEEFCFDFNSIDDSVTLLINSKEQIVAEKLKSLLKKGATSTRYKDVFDIYYLIKINPVDKEFLKYLLIDYILNDSNMKENTFYSIYNRLNNVFNNNRYLKSLDNARDNWLELPINEVTEVILNFFESFEVVEV